MKVVVSGRTFVQRENWSRWERFAEMYPESRVTLLVPEEWKEDRYGVERRFLVDHHEKYNFQVIPIPQMRFWGRELHRSLTMKLRKLKPDIYHITEERYGWWPYQELSYCRFWSGEAVAIGYSNTNMDYRLVRFHHRVKERFYFREMDAMVAVSKEAEEILRGHGYDKPVLVQQINGADERLWRPGRDDGVRRELRLKGFNIGYVGTVREEKGVMDLAEAVTRLESDDWTLVVIGDGPAKIWMQDALKKKGKLQNARFLGYRERKDIPKYVRELDVVVLPSKTQPGIKEQFGLVLVEAMLSKVAVVGSSSGGIPDVIADAGLVFPEGDVAKLKESLGMLMNDNALRRKLAEKGYNRAIDNFSDSALSRQIHDFFTQLLQERAWDADSFNHHPL